MHDFKHIIDNLASAFAETLWPTRCIGCDLPGTLLCPDCARELPYIDARLCCPRCGAPYGYLTCTQCQRLHEADVQGNVPKSPLPFVAARAAIAYEQTASRLITAYKDGDELRLDATLATLLCHAIRGDLRTEADFPKRLVCEPCDWTRWADALVHIPASREALRRRGFDHMHRVAHLVSQWTGLPPLDALRQTRSVADQRDLGSSERALNRAGSFAVDFQGGPPPEHVILVDDVFTTGATATAATDALLAGGVHGVACAVIARVW